MSELRDWQPGDGITCRYAKSAPRELPCGPPVKTRIAELSPLGRTPGRKTEPLCENHARAGARPGVRVQAAAKAARERLVVAHWAEYQEYLAQEIERGMEADR